MQLPESFDPNAVPEDDRNFEVIPAGLYKLQVIESRIQETRSGTGEMLVLTLEVIEGQYSNRKLWDQLNIRNDSPDAQRIALRALADLCLQIGVSPLTDSEQLHFKPFMGRVIIQTDKTGQYPPQNRVRYNVNLNQQQGNPAPQGSRQQQRAPQQRPAQGSGNKPWNNPQQRQPQQNQQRQPMDDEIPF